MKKILKIKNYIVTFLAFVRVPAIGVGLKAEM
jgi:hypothetical protein